MKMPETHIGGSYKALHFEGYAYSKIIEMAKNGDAGMGLCIFTFTIISSVPCLHTFYL